MKTTQLRVAGCGLRSRRPRVRTFWQPATGNWRLAAVIAAVAVIGCESSESGGSMQSRQDSALKDPFSYGPDAHDPKKAPQGLDSKHPGDGTAKSEWDRFWNP